MGVIEHLCPKLHTQTPFFLFNLQTPKDTKVNLCEGKGQVSMDVLWGGVMEHIHERVHFGEQMYMYLKPLTINCSK